MKIRLFQRAAAAFLCLAFFLPGTALALRPVNAGMEENRPAKEALIAALAPQRSGQSTQALEELLKDGELALLAPALASLPDFTGLTHLREKINLLASEQDKRFLLNLLAPMDRTLTSSSGERWLFMVHWVNGLNERFLIPQGKLLTWDLEFPKQGGLLVRPYVWQLHDPSSVEWWQVQEIRFPVAYVRNSQEGSLGFENATGVLMFPFGHSGRDKGELVLALRDTLSEELRHFQMDRDWLPALTVIATEDERLTAWEVCDFLGLQPASSVGKRLHSHPGGFKFLGVPVRAKRFSAHEIAGCVIVATEQAAVIERLQLPYPENLAARQELLDHSEVTEQGFKEPVSFLDWPDSKTSLLREVGMVETLRDIDRLGLMGKGRAARRGFIERLTKIPQQEMDSFSRFLLESVFQPGRLPLPNPAQPLAGADGSSALLERMAQLVFEKGILTAGAEEKHKHPMQRVLAEKSRTISGRLQGEQLFQRLLYRAGHYNRTPGGIDLIQDPALQEGILFGLARFLKQPLLKVTGQKSRALGNAFAKYIRLSKKAQDRLAMKIAQEPKFEATQRNGSKGPELPEARYRVDREKVESIMAEGGALLRADDQAYMLRALRAKNLSQAYRKEIFAFLTSRNLRLVPSWFKRKRYAQGQEGVDLSDHMQESTVTLMRAIAKFDPNKTEKLSTYATWWIRRGAQRGEERRRTSSAYYQGLINKYRTAEGEVMQQLKREPTSQEVAHALKWKEPRLRAVQAAMHPPIPFSQFKRQQGSEELDIESILPGKAMTHPTHFMNWRLEQAIALLDPGQRIVMKMRYGLQTDYGEYTLDEIARLNQISKERIRQIEKQAKNRLKFFLRTSQLGEMKPQARDFAAEMYLFEMMGVPWDHPLFEPLQKLGLANLKQIWTALTGPEPELAGVEEIILQAEDEPGLWRPQLQELDDILGLAHSV